jgi:hypothetical protein
MSEPMTGDKYEAARKLVDEALSEISGRDLVSSSEMTDLLLDIRLHLEAEVANQPTT